MALIINHEKSEG